MPKLYPRIPFSIFRKFSLTTIIIVLVFFLIRISESSCTSTPHLPASEKEVQLYSNQTHDDLRKIYVDAILEAKNSIHLVIYNLHDKSVLKALNEKSKEGIEVYIVCDAEACKGIENRLPLARVILRSGEGLTHQKILIIDEQKIWLGSANLSTESLRVHGNLITGIDNAALAKALVEKIKSMDEEGRSNRLMHLEVKAGEQNVELWVLPDDPQALKRMIQLFRSAKKSIKVAMFTWTRTDFAKEMIAASKRGVDVEVILDRNSGNGASSNIVQMLMEKNISVRLSTTKGLLHHKFVYIDETTLVNGSANWTNAAFKYNDDFFIVVDPLLPDQQNKMNLLWSIIKKDSDKPSK